MKFQALFIMSAVSILVFGSAGFILEKIIADPNSNIRVAEHFITEVIENSNLNAQEADVPNLEPSPYVEAVLPKCDSELPFIKKDMSLVNFLKKNNIDFSYENRTLLADSLGIPNYSASAAENSLLMDKVQSELATLSKCRI